MAVEHRNDPSTCCKVFCDVDDGGGDEEGGEGVVGVVGGPRVGKERQLPHDVLKIVPKYLHDLVFCLSPFLELIFHFDSLVLFVE